MLAQVLVLFLLLTLLFLLSKKITTYIYSFFLLITRSKKFSIGSVALIFLPGTFIHEFSHLVMATLLRVKVGELTIFPTIEKDKEVKAGKLYIAKTDPFRHTLIGLAPMVIGLTLIYLIGKILLPSFQLSAFSFRSLSPIRYPLSAIRYLAFYFLFIIPTTMFSSKKDLTSFIIAGPITLIFILALYYTGVRVVFEPSLLFKIKTFLSDLNFFLLVSAVLNFLIYLFLFFNLSLWQRMPLFRKKRLTIQT